MGRPAKLSSYVRDGEPLTASKWETGHKISRPGQEIGERHPGDDRDERLAVEAE